MSRNFMGKNYVKMLNLCSVIIVISLLLTRSVTGLPNGLQNQDEKVLIRSNYAEGIKNFMDTSANPCDDFHQYACGKWDSYHPSPYFLQTFVKMNQNINLAIHKMLSTSEFKNNLEKQATTFFSSCTNDFQINQKSIEAAASYITFLGGWPDLDKKWSENDFDLVKVLAKRLQHNQGSIINISVEPDVANSTVNGLYIVWPTTGLKDRDDYLKKSHLDSLKAYRILILDIIKLLNAPKDKAETIANDIINFETSLTDFMFSNSIPEAKKFNLTNLQSLIKNYPSFDWKKYFHEIFGYEIPLNQKIIIAVPAFDKLIELISKTNKRTLANYLAWQTIFDLAEMYLLDDNFLNAFNKYNLIVKGESISSRRVLCAHKTKMQLSFIVASMFIKEIKLDSKSKEDVIRTTEKIKTEFENRLQNAQWLDAETKSEAKLKLNHTILGIGYPDFILDEHYLKEYYNELNKFDKDTFLRNFISTVIFNQNKTLKKLNQRVDVNEWPNYITEVNALFENDKNRILFPSGILQAPVYHKYFPQVAKYGNLGFEIGYELTHGFDSTGKNYDYKGNLRSWWTEKSEKAFNEKSNCFVNQYDNYTLYGQHLSGSLTLGENIADNGGIRLAYNLYKKWRSTATPDELLEEKLPNLDDISDDKLFFIGIAQLMCSSKTKPEIVASQLQDEHSPPKFRVIGILQNFPEFSEVFECPLGSPMNPETKCELW